MGNGECHVGASNKVEIENLKREQKQQNEIIREVRNDIKEIRDHLNNRPTWPVTIIITALCTICTGLIVYIATTGTG